MRFLILTLTFCLMLPGLAQAQRDSVKVFFFGNSLVEHVSDTHETSTMYWLGYITNEARKDFAADGMFGFLREYGRKLPAKAQWSVPGVEPAWRGDMTRSGYDAVVLTPTNFIQYKPADEQYDWQNPGNISPLDASRQVLDWVRTNSPDSRLFIYEGWADMDGVVRKFPPSARQLRKYHRFNGDDYHDWYLDYLQMLQAAYPDAPPKLIPVASVLSQVFAMDELEGLKATDLYTDDAPHGTPTMYFLAAMVTYAALYDVAPPAVMVLPASIHPLIRANYGQIAAKVAELTETERVALNSQDAPGVPNPSLAMGLSGVHDWGTQYPFLDVMKTARPWLGHVPGQWGGFEAERLEQELYLDENGWPMEIPEGVEKLESYLLTDLPTDAQYFTGRYRLTYDGQGTLRVGGRARNLRYRPGEIEFSFEPGEGPVVISLLKTNPNDHIRNISVVHQDHVALHDMGVVFNPLWTEQIRDLRVLRFMDWGRINGSPQVAWQDRPQLDDYTYVRRGVPVELMVKLSNQLAIDPWFNVPHMADDSYVEAFATLVRDQLDPRRRVYVEYSNEVWNFLFPQAKYAAEQASAAWATEENGAWMQWAGMRAAQVMGIWSDVFDDPARLTRVMGVHTAWPGLEEAFMQAPLAVADGHRSPVDSFDAYAVAGYFGLEAGMEDMPERILRWHGQGIATSKLTQFLRNGPLKKLTTELLPYHAKIARQHGLQLVMYEGGTHVVARDDWVNDEALTRIFTAYNYSPQIGTLYQELLAAWEDVGGTLFNAFVDVDKPSKWGSWGAKRHLADKNPRWDALLAHNARPANWEDRPGGAFDGGVFRSGRDQDDVVQGTEWSDILIGRGGDDRLITAGGGDFILGGPGRDTAVLPGRSDEYRLAFWGQTLLVIGKDAEIALQEVEFLEFADEPGQLTELSLPN
ncbi:calcium-binding protein [Thalassovita sp.]|jgi:hypothetical protein|uniref:calcium-binding protein n=1 Tax=Thalassovita sp. TaxID=1979401 RepID=UPI003B5BDBB3